MNNYVKFRYAVTNSLKLCYHDLVCYFEIMFIHSQKYGPEAGGGGGGGGGGRDVRYLREQLRELEENNDQLKQEVKDLNRDLNGEKRAAEKVSYHRNGHMNGMTLSFPIIHY